LMNTLILWKETTLINSLEAKQIREMAVAYRKIHPMYSIGKAVLRASEAYEVFRDAEAEMVFKTYEGE
jgi:hypothetical protein